MWAVMNNIPDVTEYYSIFDDYLDFDIKPWDKHGYDAGEMIPERKVAIRYLVLAMNIHKATPDKLPTNFLSFMSEYAPKQYQEPETVVKKMQKKYSDLRDEVEGEQEDQQRVTVKTRHSNPNTGLSRQSMQGFNMAVRKGATTSDVIEKFESKFAGMGKMGPKYIDTTTRSVFWDVPDEDSIHKETWDVKTYTSKEDIARIETSSNKKRGSK